MINEALRNALLPEAAWQSKTHDRDSLLNASDKALRLLSQGREILNYYRPHNVGIKRLIVVKQLISKPHNLSSRLSCAINHYLRRFNIVPNVRVGHGRLGH